MAFSDTQKKQHMWQKLDQSFSNSMREWADRRDTETLQQHSDSTPKQQSTFLPACAVHITTTLLSVLLVSISLSVTSNNDSREALGEKMQRQLFTLDYVSFIFGLRDNLLKIYS